MTATGTTDRGLARSGASIAVATFASGILGYVYIVVLTRALGPERNKVLYVLNEHHWLKLTPEIVIVKPLFRVLL